MNKKTIHLATDLVSAFVARNHLRAEEISGLIAAVHAALADLSKPAAPAAGKRKPAVDLPWKKTIKPDHLISLIDGRSYKTLRRHLAVNGLTPAAYRERYDLPHDYPMVAAVYSEKRSALAKASGLGQQRREQAAVAPADAAAAEPAGAPGDGAGASDKRRRGRPRKNGDAA